MTWLIITHFLVLTFLSLHQDRLKSTDSLRPAWNSFAFVFFTSALFSIFKILSFNDLLLVEILLNGFIWLFLGLSLYNVVGLFFGAEEDLQEAEEAEESD